MKLEEMGLQIGDLLQLQQLSDPNARYPVRVIGYVAGKSLLTTAPYLGQGRLVALKEKQKVIIRFAVHNSVTGFKTNIIYIRTIPFPYLHLEIPDNIETMEVRKAHRVSTSITTTIRKENDKNKTTQTAQLIDISPVGARMIAAKQLCAVDDAISLTIEVNVADIERLLVLSAICRSVASSEEKNEREMMSHGLQFKIKDEDDRLTLHAYVYQKMLEQMHVL